MIEFFDREKIQKEEREKIQKEYEKLEVELVQN